MSDEKSTQDLLGLYGDVLADEDDVAMPLYGFRLIVYLDPAGEQQVIWKVDGAVRAAPLVGDIEWAKQELIFRHRRQNDV